MKIQDDSSDDMSEDRVATVKRKHGETSRTSIVNQNSFSSLVR